MTFRYYIGRQYHDSKRGDSPYLEGRHRYMTIYNSLAPIVLRSFRHPKRHPNF